MLKTIDNETHKKKLVDLLKHLMDKYPHLELVYKWKQPMLLDHGVFMLGFSVSKKHIAVAPERYGMEKFSDDIDASHYEKSKMMFRITWEQDIDYKLLFKILDFKLQDRLQETSFWK